MNDALSNVLRMALDHIQRLQNSIIGNSMYTTHLLDDVSRVMKDAILDGCLTTEQTRELRYRIESMRKK